MWVKIFTTAFNYLLSTIKNPAKQAKYEEVMLTVAGQIALAYGIDKVSAKAEELANIGGIIKL